MMARVFVAAAFAFLLAAGCGPTEEQTVEEKAEAFARGLLGESTTRLVQELGEPKEKSRKSVTANGVEEVWIFPQAVVRIVEGKVAEIKY
jgi:hypothetical protein